MKTAVIFILTAFMAATPVLAETVNDQTHSRFAVDTSIDLQRAYNEEGIIFEGNKGYEKTQAPYEGYWHYWTDLSVVISSPSLSADDFIKKIILTIKDAENYPKFIRSIKSNVIDWDRSAEDPDNEGIDDPKDYKVTYSLVALDAFFRINYFLRGTYIAMDEVRGWSSTFEQVRHPKNDLNFIYGSWYIIPYRGPHGTQPEKVYLRYWLDTSSKTYNVPPIIYFGSAVETMKNNLNDFIAESRRR